MKTPKYDVCSVIDLRHKDNSELPDRIYIDMVYWKDGCEEWMYACTSERNEGHLIYLTESYINKYRSKKTAQCYDNDIVRDMYNQGFRFCGNFDTGVALQKANRLRMAQYIKHIVLNDAVAPDGNILSGQSGLWVKYHRTINGSGDCYSGYRKIK